MPIVNGVVYTPRNNNGLSIINGVPATKHNGLHLISGVRRLSGFPGWTENDTSGIITVDDASKFDAVWTIDGQHNGALHRIYVDAGLAYWTGDFVAIVKNKIVSYSDNTAEMWFGLSQTNDIDVGTWLVGAKYALLMTHKDVAGNTKGTFSATEINNGSSDAKSPAASWTSDEDTYVWCKYYRTGSNVGMAIYSDEQMTTLLGSAQEAVISGTPAYRYIYMLVPYASAGTAVANQISQLISITPNPWL